MAKPQTNEVINKKLEEINPLIYPYQLAWVNPKTDCVLLEKNARYMTKEQLNRLSENIKTDNFLSQLPFGIYQEDKQRYFIISGNHRVKAAIKAELESVLILFGYEEDFPKEKQVALQLSHNAISGQDDLSILQELYAELEDITMKAYSGIDEQELFKYHSLDFSGISEEDVAFHEINFMFSETNKAAVNRTLDALDKKGLDKDKDAVVFGDIDHFITVLSEIENRFDIKNRSVALLRMCQICEQYLAAEAERVED